MTRGQAAERKAERDLAIIRDSEDIFGKRAQHFNKLVGEYRGLTETIKSLEEEKKVAQAILSQYFIDSGAKTILSDGSKVTLVQNQGRSTIDKMKLIEHGVSAQIIADSTVTGAPFEYIKITPAKE